MQNPIPGQLCLSFLCFRNISMDNKAKKNAKFSSGKSESSPRKQSVHQTLAMESSKRPSSDAKVSRKNAKRPREEKSTKPPPKLRQIKGLEGAAKQRNVRFDPRFSSSCGNFDEFEFHKDYAFLDELRQKDIKELKKAHRSAKKEGNAALSDRIRLNLLRLENQEKAEMERQKIEKIRAELRRENIERMNQGERPIYLNNTELMARANCATTAAGASN